MRTLKVVACTASILLLAATQAAAQVKLNRIEWFAEAGGSFFRLGQQPGPFPVPMFDGYGEYQGSYQGAVVNGNGFSSTYSLLTGLGYRLTRHDSIQLSYSQSDGNHFMVKPLGIEAAPEKYFFDRIPSLTINYVRYVGSISGWRPFVLGGGGAVWQSSLVSGADTVDPSFDFGFGADHRIMDRLAFRIEVRDYVDRLPSPFHGLSQDIEPTAGLVISSRPPESGAAGPSRVEVYGEVGASFFTGASVPTQAPVIGQRASVNAVLRNSYSKAGRFAAGFRVYLSSRNALQFGYSQAPNRFEQQLSTTEPPQVTVLSVQTAQFVKDLTADYVRCLTGSGVVKPFVAAGGGMALFGGLYTHDIHKFTFHFAAGVDIPLEKRLALRFEVDDFLSPQPSVTPVSPIHSWTNNLAPMAGLVLRFQ